MFILKLYVAYKCRHAAKKESDGKGKTFSSGMVNNLGFLCSASLRKSRKTSATSNGFGETKESSGQFATTRGHSVGFRRLSSNPVSRRYRGRSPVFILDML